jgi:hypothetical protein
MSKNVILQILIGIGIGVIVFVAVLGFIIWGAEFFKPSELWYIDFLWGLIGGIVIGSIIMSGSNKYTGPMFLGQKITFWFRLFFGFGIAIGASIIWGFNDILIGLVAGLAIFMTIFFAKRYFS